MASATHPNVDYDKSIANGIQAYYEMVETVPHMMKGTTAKDMQQMERENAVKEWKKYCAMEEKEGYVPQERFVHKRVGDDNA